MVLGTASTVYNIVIKAYLFKQVKVLIDLF